MRRAPRKSLERECAAAGKGVERRAPGQILAEPVEEGLPDAIGRRSELGYAGKMNFAAAPATADDAKHVGGHERAGRSEARTVELYVRLSRLQCSIFSSARAVRSAPPGASACAPGWKPR